MPSGSHSTAPRHLSILSFLLLVRGDVLNPGLLASLGGTDASLLALQDAFLNITEQPSSHPLMDGECRHLRDSWKTCDGTIISRILSVTTLVDEDHPPFEEPIVLLVPSICHLELHHPLHQSKHTFLDGRALLDGER